MLNVIQAIEEKLQAQKDELFLKKIEIDELKRELAAAQTEIKELREKKQYENNNNH